MANPTETANGKSPATKRAAARSSTTKRTPAKARTTARPTLSSARKAATETLTALPKWLTIGASVTGAAVAVGATLFATRKDWLPRARRLGEWVEDSVHEQLESVSAIREKIGSRRNGISDAAPQFEASGADADFKVGVAAH